MSIGYGNVEEYYTSMLNYCIMDRTNINKLADSFVLKDVLTGDYSDSVSNIVLFPFDLSITGRKKGELEDDPNFMYDRLATSNLSLNGTVRDGVYCYKHLGTNRPYFVGYFDPNTLFRIDKFLCFEPYQILDVYLPFFGTVNIPMKELFDGNIYSIDSTKVTNEKLFVFLAIDHTTGQASYIIGMSEYVEFDKYTIFAPVLDDSKFRIISIHPFQLGTSIPIGSSNMASFARNALMGAVNIGISAYTGNAMLSAGLGITNTVTSGSLTVKQNNPKTNRLKTSYVQEYSDTKTYDRTNILKQKNISDLVGASVNALNSLVTKPETGRPNNINCLNIAPYQVIFYVKRANVQHIDASYKHLNGLPLGKVKRLNELSGYTEISNIHVEGSGISMATQEEIIMLEESLKAGIIL